ncbi:MAG TPA: CDGSH iron-sulfur domain-containing protein [Actinomycetota bacterium]|jgi:CDGSH-type Zn-finger protein
MDDGSNPRIKVVEGGPYRVSGVPVVRMRKVAGRDGDVARWERGSTVGEEGPFDLCRCGQSGSKPFCDGAEKTIGFDGTETADRGPTADRRFEYGDGSVVLSDDPTLCARAAFCETGLSDAWALAEETEDPERRAMLIRMVGRCPSGRLAYHLPPDPDMVEEELPQEIGVVDDGPLWVRGGVPIEAADGFEYEVRNRVALCRCGKSKNKPFCDGSHVRTKFKDRGDWT